MSEKQPFYHLRPNKYIDRNLFTQCLFYLKRILPIEDYYYIGFGSFLFDDFKMMHTQLDISNMISIENDPNVCRRAKFNKPYSCIQIENCDSSDYISSMDMGDKNCIFWMDYTSPSDLGRQISDFCSLLDSSNPKDIIRITLNANPAALNGKIQSEDEDDSDAIAMLTAEEVHRKRLATLKARIGDYLPEDVEPDQMTRGAYPIVLLRTLEKAAMSVLFENPPYQNRFILPLFSSVYEDGQQMLTLTGIVLDDRDEAKSVKECLSKFSPITFSWDKPVQIEIPPLTQKEIIYINNLLPCENAKQQIKDNLSFSIAKDSAIDSYISFYKYYPNFHHVSL